MNVIIPDWPAPASIKACTTLRTSWYGLNKPPVAGFNYGSDMLEKQLSLPNQPIWLAQAHTNHPLEAVDLNRGKTADASYTANPQQICAVLTADCLPVLLCDKQGSQIAAIHAGWRGLSNGIIEATIKQLKPPYANLMAWLGPAIGPAKFEVGSDVWLAFTNQHPACAAYFTPLDNEKWLADLYALATYRLNQAGVVDVYGGQFCTYTQEDLFFSYRRDKTKTGRMASLIWIDKSFQLHLK